MRIPLDRRVWPGAVVLTLAVLALAPFWRAGAIGAAVLLFCHLAFFRDFERAPEGDGLLSPADGTVVEISELFENRFLQREAVKIGIFLSVFVPHVNRAPGSGTVRYLSYEPGKFLNALRQESVNWNESNWIGIEENPDRRVLVRQMAGVLARRIHWDVGVNQPVKRGDKLGIICYGSRVECFLPERSFQTLVRVGERVRAGQTVLGHWA